ncbi:hypothetical protein ACFPM0_03530 [Pseudonocardia sulfidoxydans]
MGPRYPNATVGSVGRFGGRGDRTRLWAPSVWPGGARAALP